MKTGDIVVFKPKTLRTNWPENIRDGVITQELPQKLYMVRPYGSTMAFRCSASELRVILPNRLRKNRPLPKEAPTTKVEKKKKNQKESEYQTYRGWKAIGRYVRQGERHKKRNEVGECLFHIDQTNKKETSYRRHRLDDDWNARDFYNSEQVPYVKSRQNFTGAMGASMVRLEMSDGTHKDEWLGEDGEDCAPGISLGM